MAKTAQEYAIQGAGVRALSKLVEESTRATGDSVKFFIEPTPGVLDKAKNKRHHIIFGRRGSGKSSLLHKVTADLTVSRTPIAYVDLEQFKGHSYPDVLISVLLSTLTEFKKWLDTAATSPATKTSFWMKIFGATPTKGAFPKKDTAGLSAVCVPKTSSVLRGSQNHVTSRCHVWAVLFHPCCLSFAFQVEMPA